MSFFDLKIETKTKLNALQTTLMRLWHRNVSQKEIIEKLIDIWSFSDQTWKILRRVQVAELNKHGKFRTEKEIIESLLLGLDNAIKGEANEAKTD